MNKCPCWLAVLLVMTAAVATAAFQEGVRSHVDKADAGLAWPELMASMAKMDVAMASVESSGSSDADFVRLMLPHHQAALHMAKIQLLYGKDPQMRRLAQEIITDQQSEIELMQLWLKQHQSGSQSANRAPASEVNEDH